MHETHALLTNVMIIPLCPESFCASKSANRKVLTFWAFERHTLQHQLNNYFEAIYHRLIVNSTHLTIIYIHQYHNHHCCTYIYLIVSIIRVFFNYNIIQYSPPTPSFPSLSSLSMIQAGELPDNFARWASNEFFIP